MYDVVILCGGLATRLGDLSRDCPKSLIEINGKPFIYYQLSKLESYGFDHVVLCVGHLGNKIEDYVRNNYPTGMKIEFSYDGNVPLGTGGAIKKALPLLDKRFFVMYGDSYLDIDYFMVELSYLVDGSPPGLMVVYKNEDLLYDNNVWIHKGVIRFYDKEIRSTMHKHIDYGLGLFDKRIFSCIKKDKFSLVDVYQKLICLEKLRHYQAPNRFYEIGSFEGICEFQQYVKENNIQ